MATALLDISTLIQRPTITIDGKSYELLNPEELSIEKSAWLTKAGRDIEAASRSEGSDDLGALIAAVVRTVVVDIEPDVFLKLTDLQRLSIVEVFTVLLTRRKARVAGAVARAILEAVNLSTGGSTSPGSSASTAAASPAGSAIRRSLS